jgi:5-methylcytosine-specific restriction endonuclease McrBC GTP-binding regulatory subunit McrB
VQPNWDSPQDLFGFFNYMDSRYKATELMQALVQSQASRDEGGFDDSLLIVLLDEMNLAHVELYLSEILSKLGSTRDGEATGARSPRWPAHPAAGH